MFLEGGKTATSCPGYAVEDGVKVAIDDFGHRLLVIRLPEDATGLGIQLDKSFLRRRRRQRCRPRLSKRSSPWPTRCERKWWPKVSRARINSIFFFFFSEFLRGLGARG